MLALSGVFLTCASLAFEGDLSMVLVVSGLVLALSGIALWLSSPVAMPRKCDPCDMTLLDWASMHGPARQGRDAA